MARLRLLLSLLLVTLGAMLGGMGLNGYYEPPVTRDQTLVASVTREPEARPHLSASPPRLRFVAIDSEPPATPAKPKVVAKAPSAKTKPAVKEQPSVKSKRPQQAAAQWPWSLFSN
jgi:hypothetical protein